MGAVAWLGACVILRLAAVGASHVRYRYSRDDICHPVTIPMPVHLVGVEPIVDFGQAAIPVAGWRDSVEVTEANDVPISTGYEGSLVGHLSFDVAVSRLDDL